ncbi:hypothetical protein [Pseudomonas sp. SW-3]|uniref:hypothetical protein n=1 Tax=Pseudomonas sp. SW-3 TaxID=147212 RepID=UPI001F276C35|nr:hypothetical protein [Pseudomonas sp. SW-3]
MVDQSLRLKFRQPLLVIMITFELMLSGCGSLRRPMIDTVSTPQPTREFASLNRFRFVADNAQQSMAFMQAWEADRKKAGRTSITALAISGGGGPMARLALGFWWAGVAVAPALISIS